jgi:membrane protein implicated in regulation of membrane protease activity
VTRTPGAVRTNRAVLALLGLLLLAAGVLTLLVGLRVLGDGPADRAVVDGAVDDVARAGWFWPVVGAAALLVAALSAWWLTVQARTDRLARLRLDDDAAGGRTLLEGTALTRAVEDEVADLPGVTRATAHLSGTPSAPRLHLRVRLDGRVDPADVHRAITGQVLVHARAALELDRLPTRVELDLPRGAARALG